MFEEFTPFGTDISPEISKGRDIEQRFLKKGISFFDFV